MFLFNETVGIDADAAQEWLQWMKEKHLPDVLKRGMFIDAKIYKVLHDQEEGTISYSVQYFAISIEHVQQFLDVYGPVLIEEHKRRYANKHVAFRTLLEQV